MTEAQIAMLTANVFLAALIGKHWLNAALFAAYFTMALVK
jgi:hypothetical protein